MYGTVTINVLANENVRSEKSLYGLDRISLWLYCTSTRPTVAIGGGWRLQYRTSSDDRPPAPSYTSAACGRANRLIFPPQHQHPQRAQVLLSPRGYMHISIYCACNANTHHEPLAVAVDTKHAKIMRRPRSILLFSNIFEFRPSGLDRIHGVSLRR